MDDKENLLLGCPFDLPVPDNVVRFVNAFDRIIKYDYHDLNIIRRSLKNITLKDNLYYNDVKSIPRFKSYIEKYCWDKRDKNEIIAFCVYYKYKGYLPYCIKDEIVYLYKYNKSNNKIYQNKVKLSRFLYIIGGKEVIQDTNNLKHTLLSNADDIEYAYKNISKSCMSDKFLHSRAYADNDKLSLMVIHTGNYWKSSAKVRLVVNTKTKTYCKFYSNGDLTNSTIASYLSKLGYDQSMYTLDNCTLKLIFKQSVASGIIKRSILIPCLDGIGRVNITDNGLHIKKRGRYTQTFKIPFDRLNSYDILKADKLFKNSADIYHGNVEGIIGD